MRLHFTVCLRNCGRSKCLINASEDDFPEKSTEGNISDIMDTSTRPRQALRIALATSRMCLMYNVLRQIRPCHVKVSTVPNVLICTLGDYDTLYPLCAAAFGCHDGLKSARERFGGFPHLDLIKVVQLNGDGSLEVSVSGRGLAAFM